ncbi:MAG: GAF domain-containing protein, partial [Candidatus Aminicenantes bacterium]|nr:GAF domain-containing protein [Candidatus Aminicenantes bacterium]
GKSIVDMASYRKIEKDLFQNQTLQFTLQRQAREFTVTLRPLIHFPWFQTISILIIVCVYLGIGILSRLKRPEDPRVKLLFLLTVLASITVIIPDYYANQLGGIDFLIFNFLMYAAYGTLIGVEPHLALVIPAKKKLIKKHPRTIKYIYICGAGVMALSYLRYISSVFHFSLSSGFSRTIFFLFVAVYQLLVPLMVFGILLHTFFKASVGIKKIQTKIVLFGIFPWMVSMVLSALINLTTGQLPYLLYLFNLVCIIPVPFAFLIAIFKYRLFDVELVIRKSLVYGVLTGFLFLVYYGTIGIGSGLFSLIFNDVKSLWIVAFATLLLGLLFNPLRKQTQWYVDKFFYPEKFNLRSRLPELSKEVASSSTLQELVFQILEKLSKLLNMPSAAFLLADETNKKFSVVRTGGSLSSQNLEREIIFSADEPLMAQIARHKKPIVLKELYRQIEISNNPKLEKLNADIILPFYLQNNLVAVLFLGGKEDKSKLSREDRDLLAIFCNQVAAMIENARLFHTAT